MSEKTTLEQWFDNLETDDFDDVKLDFAVLVAKALEAKNKSRTDLAADLNVSPARITKVLRGDANLTMEVMHKIAKALDQKLHLHFAPKGAKVHTFTALPGQNQVFSVTNTKMNNTVPLSHYMPLAIAA